MPGGAQGRQHLSQRPPRRRPTVAAAANFLLSTLSPIFSMAKVGGPTQVAPADSTAFANAGFSLRKPGEKVGRAGVGGLTLRHPGLVASAAAPPHTPQADALLNAAQTAAAHTAQDGISTPAGRALALGSPASRTIAGVHGVCPRLLHRLQDGFKVEVGGGRGGGTLGPGTDQLKAVGGLLSTTGPGHILQRAFECHLRCLHSCSTHKQAQHTRRSSPHRPPRRQSGHAQRLHLRCCRLPLSGCPAA